MTTAATEMEDYIGEDGLLYCGKCHTPKEAYFPEGKELFGRDRHPAECDWTAENIYTRSKELLEFMENRWEFGLNNEQLDKLVYVNFAVDGRTVPEEMTAIEKIL